MGYHRRNEQRYSRNYRRRCRHSHREEGRATYCRHNKCRKEETEYGNRPAKVVELPWEIICNIFSRLPIKSLARFRTVSKTLNQLTKDHHFIGLQREQQGQHTFILTRRQHIFSRSYLSSIYLMEKQKQKEKWMATRIPFMDYLQHIPGLEIVSTCNGLLCLSDNINILCSEAPLIIVYNPLTKERIVVPKLVIQYRQCLRNIYISFHDKRKEYKVIMMCISDGDTARDDLDGYVITLGETCWRKLNIPAVSSLDLVEFANNRKSVFFNREFYWILSKKINSATDSHPVIHILAMDICNETFRVIELVDTSAEAKTTMDHCLQYQLFDAGKHLGLLATTHHMYQYSWHSIRLPVWRIWHLVDSERGVWIQKTAIEVAYCEPNIKVVGAVGDDSILMLLYGKFEKDAERSYIGPVKHRPLLCNLKTGELSSNILSDHIPMYFQVFPYVPAFLKF